MKNPSAALRKAKEKIYRGLRAQLSGPEARRFRENCPAQLHDLFMLAQTYTEDIDHAMKALASFTNSEDVRKQPGPIFPGFYDSGPRYREFLKRIIEDFNGAIVVETGIAHGHSTRVILEALSALHNRQPELRIHLHSLDVDERTQWSEFADYPHWTFHLVDDERDVDAILEEIGEMDVFIHDSDHSYRHQMKEYQSAWRHLKPGGFLVSDDISWSNAFSDFCRQTHVQPVILSEAPKVAGVVQKPQI